MTNRIRLISSKTQCYVYIDPNSINESKHASIPDYIERNGVVYVVLDNIKYNITSSLNRDSDTLIDTNGQVVMCAIDDIIESIASAQSTLQSYQHRVNLLKEQCDDKAKAEAKEESESVEITTSLPSGKSKPYIDDTPDAQNECARALIDNIKSSTSIIPKATDNSRKFRYRVVRSDEEIYPDYTSTYSAVLKLKIIVDSGSIKESFKSKINHIHWEGNVYVPHDYVYQILKVAIYSRGTFSKEASEDMVERTHRITRQELLDKNEFDLRVPNHIDGEYIRIHATHVKLLRMVAQSCAKNGVIIDVGICRALYNEGQLGRVEQQCRSKMPKIFINI